MKSQKSYITYKGLLVDYQLGAKGTLDSICLQLAEGLIWKDKKPDQLDFPVDIFVIPANEILNLTIDYVYLKEMDTETNNTEIGSS